MRLWHFKLIPVLPRQQLLGQWRECCLIAKELKEKGTPNHILVDPVINYASEHFIAYCRMVSDEMRSRGYHVNTSSLEQYLDRPFYVSCTDDQLFPGWHTDDYLRQCYYNLEEKHDRGGMTDEEWNKIEVLYNER